jgi:hypothetical protein
MKKWEMRYPSEELVQIPEARRLDGEKIVFGNDKEYCDSGNTADWTKGFRSMFNSMVYMIT